MLSLCFLEFSVGVWAFVVGLSKIFSFLSCQRDDWYISCSFFCHARFLLVHTMYIINGINK